MSVLARLQEAVIAAMRAKQADRRTTLRMLVSDLKNAGIDKKGKEGLTDEVASPAEHLTDDEVIKVLQSALKRRKESAEQYREGDRPELAAKEESEAKMIQEFLPEGLGEAALEALVQAAIDETGADSPAQMGAIMKAVMPKIAGRADGKAVSAAVKKLLS